MTAIDAVAPRCPVCGHALKPDAAFCGGCGHRLAGPPPDRGDIRTLITFYVVSLAIAALAMIYVRITDDAFHAAVGGTLALGVVSVGYALSNRELVSAPMRTLGFSAAGYGLILLASVPILLLIAGYTLLIPKLVGIHLQNELDIFAGHGTWVVLVMIVVVPPLEEELAFRGLIFGGLRRTLSVTDAFLISSFAFAMLHLSIPSLVTHFPLGLYLCWLRHRSGSLWPGVFAHACHNLGVCILEWW